MLLENYKNNEMNVIVKRRSMDKRLDNSGYE